MKKLLTLLALTLTTLSVQASECHWPVVIDVNKWYKNYQVPEAQMIRVIQVIGSRYVVFDSWRIVLDTAKTNIKSVNYNQSLKSIMNEANHFLIGKIGEVELDNLAGFPMQKDVFEVVSVEEFFSKCKTKKEREIMLGKSW
jgi:hypothetical protein